MSQSNQPNIQAWSQYTDEDIAQFGEEGDDSRKYVLNPVLFNLLGDIKGKQILDAGSGTGYLSRLLAKRGAKVTAVEPSESLFSYSSKLEKEYPLDITHIREDLSLFSQPNMYDYVVANMVFMDILDYQTAIKNCIDSLKINGELIFSISHPCFPGTDSEWQELQFVKVRQYFDAEVENNKYGKSWRRPIQDYLKILFKNGCMVTGFIEPQADKELVDNNKNWERNYKVPQFLIIKAKKY